MPRLLARGAMLGVALLTCDAHAQSSPNARAHHAYAFDVELDPIAYALGGYSLHVGLRWDVWRLDLGAFAANVPAWFHRSEGLDAYMSGFGAKLDYRFFEGQSGPFVGVESSIARAHITEPVLAQAARQTLVKFGLRTGWEFRLVSRLYVVPWLGAGVALGGQDVRFQRTPTGARWDHRNWTFFATVHFGWRIG